MLSPRAKRSMLGRRARRYETLPTTGTASPLPVPPEVEHQARDTAKWREGDEEVHPLDSPLRAPVPIVAASRPSSCPRDAALGAINGILVTPVLMSFAAIIFQDAVFAPHLPRLVRLVIVSGTVHQLVFTLRSTLPFAVGSVQDAGLIFLSAIASAVAAAVRAGGADDEAMLSTVCFALCGSTAALGVALVVTGRLKLASAVQYLPMPVIGGYLAYIGFFCGAAGLSFTAANGAPVVGAAGWARLLRSPSALLRAAPSVAAGAGLYWALRRFRSVATLPACMLAMVVAFYAVLLAAGVSLDEARAAGWVAPASPSMPVWGAWAFFKPGEVIWSAILPRIFPDFAGMFLVVAFSSSLDIAAVEMELGAPLDYGRELQTVGWSNICSGLTGGFTGSYIFSQTIFNLRAGVDSRLAGATTVAVQAAVVMLPVSLRCSFAFSGRSSLPPRC
ncbi:unnamed protein product [Phaeothamnion confervicola]